MYLYLYKYINLCVYNFIPKKRSKNGDIPIGLKKPEKFRIRLFEISILFGPFFGNANLHLAKNPKINPQKIDHKKPQKPKKFISKKPGKIPGTCFPGKSGELAHYCQVRQGSWKNPEKSGNRETRGAAGASITYLRASTTYFELPETTLCYFAISKHTKRVEICQ